MEHNFTGKGRVEPYPGNSTQHRNLAGHERYPHAPPVGVPGSSLGRQPTRPMTSGRADRGRKQGSCLSISGRVIAGWRAANPSKPSRTSRPAQQPKPYPPPLGSHDPTTATELPVNTIRIPYRRGQPMSASLSMMSFFGLMRRSDGAPPPVPVPATSLSGAVTVRCAECRAASRDSSPPCQPSPARGSPKVMWPLWTDPGLRK